MRLNDGLLRQIEMDLSLNSPFVKGMVLPIRNCWHFYSDGNSVDAIFRDDDDFRDGMNRVYVVSRLFPIVIIAFILMDTHVHFILYGEYEACNKFVHEYIRRTSMAINSRYGDSHKLDGVEIGHQEIDDDQYLKIAICYVFKNAPVGGIPFNALDYPWSSAGLMFKRRGYWTSPVWYDQVAECKAGKPSQRKLLKTHVVGEDNPLMVDGIVFPGEYVAWKITERIFKTHRGFNYFMCISKDSDVESRGGSISHLSIPMQEMRQHKNELCRKLFGASDIRSLSTTERLRLARTLKHQYNSSIKQIARLCGLVYDEVKDII